MTPGLGLEIGLAVGEGLQPGNADAVDLADDGQQHAGDSNKLLHEFMTKRRKLWAKRSTPPVSVLDQTGQSSVVYEAVARCTIEIAKSGERNPQQLRHSAFAAVGHKRLIPLPPRN